jgi:hypothetical protein
MQLCARHNSLLSSCMFDENDLFRELVALNRNFIMHFYRYDIRGGQPLAVVQGATDAATSVRRVLSFSLIFSGTFIIALANSHHILQVCFHPAYPVMAYGSLDGGLRLCADK